jgi:hypothetical protein
MGHGEAWWFLRDDSVAVLDEVIVALRDAGLVAGNPATGVPEMIDGDGRQVPWESVDVKRRWTEGETVTVQLWINREVDVLVELTRPQQLFTFDLDGMTTAEARFTSFAVLNAAFSFAATEAVIIDRDLPDNGDAVLVARAEGSLKATLAATPDLLALAEGVGRYRVNVREGSWLSKPATCIESFGGNDVSSSGPA